MTNVNKYTQLLKLCCGTLKNFSDAHRWFMVQIPYKVFLTQKLSSQKFH